MNDSSFFTLEVSVNTVPKSWMFQRAVHNHDATKTCLNEGVPVIVTSKIVERRENGRMYLPDAYISYGNLKPLLDHEEEITKRLLHNPYQHQKSFNQEESP